MLTAVEADRAAQLAMLAAELVAQVDLVAQAAPQVRSSHWR